MGLRVAVLGATGAVGQELVRLLGVRSWCISDIRLLASPRSAGSMMRALGGEVEVRAVAAEEFHGVDYAFFSAGAERSREWAAAATEAGATVIDNSSAFRLDPGVPLVVPEVNGHLLEGRPNLVANPNCCAIILLMAVAPLRRLGRVRRLIVSTYQSASGGGAAMMQDLFDQTCRVVRGEEAKPEVTPHPYAFNLFSHNTPVGPDGMNEEEAKVVAEVRKILDQPELGVNVTCVRVPVLRAHSESVTVEFEGPAPAEDEVRQVLRESPGVRVVDDREANRFPMPCEASGVDEVLVGRIRRDPSEPRAVSLFVCGDQLLKGAALNAVQIAESLVARSVSAIA